MFIFFAYSFSFNLVMNNQYTIIYIYISSSRLMEEVGGCVYFFVFLFSHNGYINMFTPLDKTIQTYKNLQMKKVSLWLFLSLEEGWGWGGRHSMLSSIIPPGSSCVNFDRRL